MCRLIDYAQYRGQISNLTEELSARNRIPERMPHVDLTLTSASRSCKAVKR